MELYSLLLISCYLVLLQEVEGSGIPPLLPNNQKVDGAGMDIEWDGSGISPDDEDGDVIEGSGDQTDEIDDVGEIPVAPSTPIYPLNITQTTTHYSSFDIHELELEPEEEDVAIEEVPATTITSATVKSWTTTSRRPLLPLTPLITEQTAPPTVFEEKHIPFDTLLKPGVLAALIGGIVVGILVTILLVMFIVYRMRKKDEGSYALDEPKQPPHYSYAYQKAPTKEFYA